MVKTGFCACQVIFVFVLFVLGLLSPQAPRSLSSLPGNEEFVY